MVAVESPRRTQDGPPSFSFVYSVSVCACFFRLLISGSIGVSFVFSFVVFLSGFGVPIRCLILVFRVSLSCSVCVFSFFDLVRGSGSSFSY